MFKVAVVAFTVLAVASAAVLRPVVRAKQLPSIGMKPYTLRQSSEGADCPQNVTHGLGDSPPLFTKNFMGFGIQASMNFSNIVIDNNTCTGDVNDSAVMVVLPKAELTRYFNGSNPLGLDGVAIQKVVVAGIDTQKRKCGAYDAPEKYQYFFTQEIGAYKAALAKINVNVPSKRSVSGEMWMLMYHPSKGVCAYIDVNAPSYVKEMSETPGPEAIEPVEPATPTKTPAAPPISDGTSTGNPPAGSTNVDGTPAPTPESTNAPAAPCFPSTATVELEDGSCKTMDAIELGDRVKVADGVFSDVFMFTHKLADIKYDFVNIKTNAGRELSLTAGHYMYINSKLVPAGTVKVGDVVESADAKMTVTEVSTKRMTGLFNPQTTHGDIIVDGVRASTYTKIALPEAAHAMLAPIRSLYARFGFTTAVLDAGADRLALGVSKILA